MTYFEFQELKSKQNVRTRCFALVNEMVVSVQVLIFYFRRSRPTPS